MLFLLAGSLIFTQCHYQSINKIQIKHTFIKTTLLFSSYILILSLSKESIIYSSNSIYSSLFIILLLLIGTVFTIIYTFNIYLSCFYYSLFNYYSLFIYYSFIIPFLIISSLIIDIILEYSISLNFGTLFYTIDNSTFITYILINDHFSLSIVFLILLLLFIIYL